MFADNEDGAHEVIGALSQDRNIDLEDETTMPSDWTPYPHHVTDQ